MAEVLVQFTEPVPAPDGRLYIARACGGAMPDGLWEGWIEFIPVDSGEPLRLRRETTQPKRDDAVYWATGLTPVYLEGSLERTLRPPVRHAPAEIPPPIFDGPAEDTRVPPPVSDSILNPFSVYRKGEAQLRRQLGALSAWHLVNIIRDHELSDLDAGSLERLDEAALIETIVAAVRRRAPSAAR